MPRHKVVLHVARVAVLEAVLRADVLLPLGDDEEPALAQRADVWVLVGVDADLVALHVAQVAEAQRAVGALVGAFARMRAQVHRQRRVVHEGLAALRACIWLLLHVRPQVNLQVAGAGETEAAHVAHVGTLPCVYAHVRPQVPWVLVALVALGARVAAAVAAVRAATTRRPVNRVCCLRMLLQVLALREGLAAHLALVRCLGWSCRVTRRAAAVAAGTENAIVSLLVVEAQVHPKVLLAGEALATHGTAKWPLARVHGQVLTHGGCIVGRVRAQRTLQRRATAALDGRCRQQGLALCSPPITAAATTAIVVFVHQ